ncbi:ABC transporter permease [Pseudoclavibacter endophyticus]|nr:amino acid ABC transporter permease [Pseudoclavibacter endophyticus]GGA70816.1 ABC transporter permease [Pseudoclavibacter endophyticus]
MNKETPDTGVITQMERQVREEVDLSAKVVPVRHWGRGVLTVIVALIALQITWALATNEHIHWEVVASHLFSGSILNGLWVTLQLTALSLVISLVLAVIAAVLRMSKSKVVSGVSFAYVFFFRAIPLIVLLIFVGNLGLFVTELTLGIPFTEIVFFSIPVNQVFTPFVASVVGLSLAASAYMSEIVRAGLLSVNRGQYAAAMALGLDRGKTLRYIVIPQAMRVIIPPMGNEFITMLKMSALVSVIAGGDLLTAAQAISGVNYRTIELLIVATIWYIVVIIVVSVFQYFIERRTAEK